MSNQGSLSILLPCLCLTTFARPVGAMTLEYFTTAKALTEGGWIDPYFGDLIATPVTDSREAADGPSYADAYWHEIQYAGKLDINIAASATADPNLIVLTTDLSGSFRSEAGTPLLTYFYQWAEGTVEALVHIDEFPPGTPCSLHFDVSWPQDTWTSSYFWRLETTSTTEWMECGYDPNGPYGPRRGSITAFAGEPVHLFLGTVGEGLYEIGGTDALGVGRIQLDARLTVSRHIADLRADGFVNFEDFAVFARQWRCATAGPDANADFDGSGVVDMGDLQWLAHYWLLSPRPPAAGDAQE